MLFLAISGVVALIAYLPARVDITSRTKVASFPMNIGDWKAEEIKLDESVFRILETRNLFVRDYKNKRGEVVQLYVVYSEDNRKVSHPPEVCLMGSGGNVANKAIVDMPGNIKGVKLIVEYGPNQEMIVYWYKAGKFFTPNYLRQQAHVVIDRMLGKRTAGALIRVSAAVKDGDYNKALALIRSFCKEAASLVDKYLP